MSDFYSRSPMPHENEDDFGRVLKEIAVQDLMPKPIGSPPQFWEAETYKEYFGDNYHWDGYRYIDAWVLWLRYFKNLCFYTLGLAGTFYLFQPVLRPLPILYHQFADLVKYTLFMTPRSLEYTPFSVNIRSYRFFPLFPTPFKDYLHYSYRTFFLRAPFFLAGAWLGSFVVKGLERAYGENRMLKTRMAVMMASGSLALWIMCFRNRYTNYLRTPYLIFVAASTSIWFIDSISLKRQGFDAVWNPMGFKLPKPIVEVLVGEPFNGELIAGPLKYVTFTVLETLGKVGFAISDAVDMAPTAMTELKSLLNQWKKDREKPKDANDDDDGDLSRPFFEHSNTLERRIEEMELEQLEELGFLDDVKREMFAKYEGELKTGMIGMLQKYDKSIWNPYDYLPQYKDRLSTLTLRLVRSIFGSNAIHVIDQDTLASKSVNEIIFGNLSQGIERAGTEEEIEYAEMQMKRTPSEIGDRSFEDHARQFQDMAKSFVNQVANDVTNFQQNSTKSFFSFLRDPVGTIFTESDIEEVQSTGILPKIWSKIYESRARYVIAFDDRKPLVEPQSEQDSLPASETSLESEDSKYLLKPLRPSFLDPIYDEEGVERVDVLKSRFPPPDVVSEDFETPYLVDLPPLIPESTRKAQIAKYKEKIESQGTSMLDKMEKALTTPPSMEPLMRIDAALGQAIQKIPSVDSLLGSDPSSSTEQSSFESSPSSSDQSPELSEADDIKLKRSNLIEYVRRTRGESLARQLEFKYIPDGEYYRMIKESVDQDPKIQLPEGVTPEIRLMNFLENIGGRDFEEPSEYVKILKVQTSRRWRWWNISRIPVLHTKMKNKWDEMEPNLAVVARSMLPLPDAPLPETIRAKNDQEQQYFGQIMNRAQFKFHIQKFKVETQVSKMKQKFSSLFSSFSKE